MQDCSGSQRISLLALAVGLAIGLLGCGGGGMGFDPHACDGSQAPGVWDVSLDYGGGKTVVQRWTISRDYCTLTIVADPNDEYSPSYGFVQDSGFWASWTSTVGACNYYVDLTATVAGNSFTAPIDWSRSANGTGECLSALGRIMAAAVRR